MRQTAQIRECAGCEPLPWRGKGARRGLDQLITGSECRRSLDGYLPGRSDALSDEDDSLRCSAKA